MDEKQDGQPSGGQDPQTDVNNPTPTENSNGQVPEVHSKGSYPSQLDSSDGAPEEVHSEEEPTEFHTDSEPQNSPPETQHDDPADNSPVIEQSENAGDAHSGQSKDNPDTEPENSPAENPIETQSEINQPETDSHEAPPPAAPISPLHEHETLKSESDHEDNSFVPAVTNSPVGIVTGGIGNRALKAFGFVVLVLVLMGAAYYAGYTMGVQK